MSMLSRLERRLEDAVEGAFSRAFPSPVQPVEIARRLSRTMEEGKVLSLSAVYAPNAYRVCLNPKDFAPVRALSSVLTRELLAYMTEQVQQTGYRLAGPLSLALEEREEVTAGQVLVEAQLLAKEDLPFEQPVGVITGGMPVAHPAPPPPAAVVSPKGDTRVFRLPRDMAAELVVREGTDLSARLGLGDAPATLGRRRDCDLMLTDRLVSRIHARIERGPEGHVLVDLESTNGTLVNGERVERRALRDGDVIVLGETTLEYRVAPWAAPAAT